MEEQIDVLVIGAGLAGCLSAYFLAKEGVEVTIISSQENESSSLPLIQEGMFLEKEQKETLIHYLNEVSEKEAFLPAMAHLVENLFLQIKDFFLNDFPLSFQKKEKLFFTKEKEKLKLTSFFDHDHIEKTIYEAVVSELKKINHVRFLYSHIALDLITLEKYAKKKQDRFQKPSCFGAFVWDIQKQRVCKIFSKETVLATGGIGQLYRHSTGSSDAYGSGIAMALRAGVRVLRMEQIFFHPLSLYVKQETCFPLHEHFLEEKTDLMSYRGVSLKQSIMSFYSLGKKQKVSEILFEEMQKNRSPHFWYDGTNKNSEIIRKDYPYTYEHCLMKGFDITKKAIPVVPAEHFLGGGIAVDLKGRTSMQRLHAVGQVACTGLHGKSFEESIYLMESFVWANSLAQDIKEQLQRFVYGFPLFYSPSFSTDPLSSSYAEQDIRTIKETLWNYAGIQTDKKKLKIAKKAIVALEQQIEDFYEDHLPIKEMIDARNGVLVARRIIESMLI